MVDSEENYKFDLGIKGLNAKLTFEIVFFCLHREMHRKQYG